MYMAYHVDLVKTACKPYFNDFALDQIIGANFNCDLVGNVGWKIVEKHVYPLMPLGKIMYNKDVHLDICRSFEELAKSWRGRIALLDQHLDPQNQPSPVRVIRSLGHATHAMADIYTHCNYVELLYDFFRGKGISEPQLAGHIAENAVLFSELVDNTAAHPDLQPLLKELYSDECIPDVGPRSHAEINKDYPKSKRCTDPRYPGIFQATLELARRETVTCVTRFMDRLAAERPDVSAAVRAFGEGRAFKEPGRAMRRAMRLTAIVGTWD